MSRLPDPTAALDASWAGAVHDLFARQAARRGAAAAVVTPDGSWTYAELRRRAGQLASELTSRGVEPGQVVALHGQRGAALVQGVLGVLEAGAVFLILDPAYPSRRLVDYLQQARPRGWVQVGDASPAAELRAFVDESPTIRCRLFAPEGRAVASRARGGAAPTSPPAPGPDDPACLTFTSGSTGEPRGVTGRHGPLTHFLDWTAEAFALGAADRFSMLSSLCHDPLQRDIFTPLTLGATLCIPRPADLDDSARLVDWLGRQRISAAHLTPALGEQLCAAADARDIRLPDLRRVFFVGEALTRDLVARLGRVAPRAEIVSYYGATETQRAVAYHRCVAAGEERHRATYPAGEGIVDVQLLVVSDGRLAGIDEPGQIVVRSPHLAAGYLSDPELTARRFRTSPFSGDPADRVYYTGDRGRFLEDGRVEFLGRLDHQVKIRGHRVEPDEVAARLSRHPEVMQAAVLLRQTAGGEDLLVAYVVPPGGEQDRGQGRRAPDPAPLRQYLLERLPGFMTPARFEFLERLPLTPNNKIDRAALAAIPLSGGDGAPSDPAAAPAPGPVEQAVAQIWRDVLELDSVGPGDDFFALGGHSLLATRVVVRLRRALGIELPERALFERSTLSAFAAAVAEALLAADATNGRP